MKKIDFALKGMTVCLIFFISLSSATPINEPSCGDGIINQEWEQCDDGNIIANDGCSALCQSELNPVCLYPDSLGDTTHDTVEISPEPSLQSIFNDVNYLVDVNADQKQYQIWNFGELEDVNLTIEFVNSFAGYATVFGYYLDGNKDTFTPLFRMKNLKGNTHPGYPEVDILQKGESITASISGHGSIGFAIDSYNANNETSKKTYTENALNPDSLDQAVVYDVNKYAVGFEDNKITIGDRDYQDAVVFFNPLSCSNPVFCGDGIINQDSEQCDGEDGVPEGYLCTETCELEYIPFCGDEIVNQESEQCDGEDGVPEGYVCLENCELEILPYCGDGIVNQESEQCDDGNNENEDGCSAVCEFECVPETAKTYGEPIYIEENKEWINLSSLITFDVNYSGEFCGNEAETYYRVTLVDDEYCNNREACLETEGSGEWNLYNGAFNISEESCHLIEFYSSADVNETITQQCAFVDDTPPLGIKEVGKPNSVWDGKSSIFYPWISDYCWSDSNESIDCWKVSLDTPLNISCTDQEPHPVGYENACFKVELDGDDATESYCTNYDGDFNANGDNYCCVESGIEEFYFLEESEHNLSYYCEDKLGNTSTLDDEKFKVEGRTFKIMLNKKWNLISVPFSLQDNNIEKVFSEIAENIDSVWSYDSFDDLWQVYRPSSPETSNLHTVKAGEGYMVASLEDEWLLVWGNLFSPINTPPSKEIKEGWNLIGYYGTDGQTQYNGPLGQGKSAECTLFSLGASFNSKAWSSLLTYWEPNNPNQEHYFGQDDALDPGAGYWLLTSEDGIYSYNTVCGEED
ncbi:MAG: DUF4215 domain-containing protein [archaeon]|nr:DUF4215 domain-containing protein [archaeon]